MVHGVGSSLLTQQQQLNMPFPVARLTSQWFSPDLHLAMSEPLHSIASLPQLHTHLWFIQQNTKCGTHSQRYPQVVDGSSVQDVPPLPHGLPAHA